MHPTHSIWVGSLTILLRLSFIPRKTRNLQQNQNKEPKLLWLLVSNVLDIQSLSITICHYSLHENISFLRCEDNSDIISLHNPNVIFTVYWCVTSHYTSFILQTTWRSGTTLLKVFQSFFRIPNGAQNRGKKWQTLRCCHTSEMHCTVHFVMAVNTCTVYTVQACYDQCAAPFSPKLTLPSLLYRHALRKQSVKEYREFPSPKLERIIF